MAPEDSTITEAKLSAAGFPFTTILSDQFFGNYYSLSVPPGCGFKSYLDSLEALPLVAWARYNSYLRVFEDTNDDLLLDQWAMTSTSITRLQEAWDFQIGVSSEKIAILDTGWEIDHPDLKYFATINLSDDPVPNGDYAEHGTGVAGVAAALTNNTTGVAGVAGLWDDAQESNLIVAKLHSTLIDGGGAVGVTYEDASEAVMFAVANGARIINMSFGSNMRPPLDDEADMLDKQINTAVNLYDVVVVCAAGQPGASNPTVAWPASKLNTIAVGGITQQGNRYGYYGAPAGGKGLDVLAPCDDAPFCDGDILTTDLLGDAGCNDDSSADGDYMQNGHGFNGTSAAAPYVAGVAALVRAANPGLSWSEVREIIRHSARKTPSMGSAYYDAAWGFGVVDALGAVVGAIYDAQLVEGVVAADTTFPATNKPFTNIYLWSDVWIDSGAVATIQPGTDVLVPDVDHDNLGTSSSKVELIVDHDATLIAGGSYGDPVTFQRSVVGIGDPNQEGSWYGIRVLGGSLFADYAIVSDAIYGVYASGADTVAVLNSEFFLNENEDIVLGGAGLHLAAHLEENIIEVGGGTGIRLLDAATGGLVKDNVIVGNEESSNGIHLGSYNSVSPYLRGNNVSGFEEGKAVWVDGVSSAPVLVENTLSESKYGLYITSCSPTVGTSSSSSDNFIEDNSSAGIYVTGSGGAPTIRNSRITGNYNGVVAASGAYPVMGTSSVAGYNSIASNSNYCVWNRNSGGTQVQAQWNWWGSNNPPTCTNGSVSIGTWLSTAPAARPSDTEPVPEAPERKHHVSAWPNPSTNRFHIQYATPKNASGVELTILDLMGRSILSYRLVAGMDAEVTWDGLNDRGERVSNGIYFARLHGNGFTTESTRLVLLR